MHLELGEAGRGERLSAGLGTLAEHLGGLGATDTSTPLATLLIVLVSAGESFELDVIKCKRLRRELTSWPWRR
jgi:hypothetical protein